LQNKLAKELAIHASKKFEKADILAKNGSKMYKKIFSFITPLNKHA